MIKKQLTKESVKINLQEENTIKVSELSTELQEFFAGIREEIDFHSLSDKDKKAYIIRDLEEVQF